LWLLHPFYVFLLPCSSFFLDSILKNPFNREAKRNSRQQHVLLCQLLVFFWLKLKSFHLVLVTFNCVYGDF
jgi:hypothetical protein